MALESSTDVHTGVLPHRRAPAAGNGAVVSPLRRLADRLRDSNLRLALDTPLPPVVPVGRGQALPVAGWCYHPGERIVGLELLVNGGVQPIACFGIPRPDVARAHADARDPRGHAARSGFRGFVVFPPVDRRRRVDIGIRARLAGGRRCTRALGRVELEPARVTGPQPAPRAAAKLPSERGDASGGFVAVCMTTCDPPLVLFREQVESIRAQTHRNWTCIVVDDASRPHVFRRIREVIGPDPRFRLHRNESRLGFYHNFERCLGFVPEEADFVALADHDDRWHADKLQTLLAAVRPGTTLVYSDMNIVDEDGRVLAPTYWTTRRNNHTRLGSLILANTVTGAASLFPRSLLADLLPFPPRVGQAFHDHWIGAVALALGRVAYVDRPLYDYVQHAANALGHHAPPLQGLAAGAGAWWSALGGGAGDGASLRSRAGALKGRWRAVYEADVLRLQMMATLLEMRGGGRLSKGKRRVLRRIQRLDRSPLAYGWLVLRGLLRRGPGQVTLGVERKLAGAILWRRLTLLRARHGGVGA